MASKGSLFEKTIAASFKGYAKGHIAYLARMPFPTRVIGSSSKGGLNFVRTGKPPYDVYGFTCRDATMIGAELKSSKRKESLPIVGPDKHGDGLQFHQLDALSQLIECGGIGKIVWDNGGEVGVLSDEDIVLVHQVYMDAYRTEKSGRTPQKGSKSIPWDRFTTIDYTNLHGEVAYDWLML